jgi:hypothetical protein
MLYTPQSVFMKLDFDTLAHLNGVLNNPTIHVYSTIVARQRLGKNVTAATNTQQ